ncbi:MAG: putative transposase, partial [Polyangiales bacterium]
QTVFVSARTLHRRYLLKPDAEMKDAVLYLLGHYAEKWGIEVLVFSFMSNHYHAVLRDTRGVRPRFFADFHRTLAQVVKAKYGWSGAVFKELAPPVVLHSAFAVADKIAYTLANPVAAGAVRYPRDWPGLISRLVDMGIKRYRAKRPEHYFGKQKTLPEESSFELMMCPWLLAHYGSRDSALAALKARLKDHVDKALRAVKAKGWKFLGADRVMKLSPFKRAKSYEVFGKLTPHFATIGLSVEETIAVKRAFLQWQARYDECRERFLRGEFVIWPAGTWAMVQFFGQVAEAP